MQNFEELYEKAVEKAVTMMRGAGYMVTRKDLEIDVEDERIHVIYAEAYWGLQDDEAYLILPLHPL